MKKYCFSFPGQLTGLCKIVFLMGFLTITACSSLDRKPHAMAPLHPVATAADKAAGKCMLPGQIRKLGTNFTYLTPKRAVQTSFSDCKIRGGEMNSGI